MISALAAISALANCAPTPRNKGNDTPTFVSLNPCLDAILVEVADPEQILALSHYSRDPASSSMNVETARGFAMTGGTAEEIIALSPDIVLASTFIAPSMRAALEQAGLRVETFGSAANRETSAEQIRTLAALAHASDKGDALIARFNEQPALPSDERISALLWQPGQIVAGEASLVAQHIEWAGLSNHAQAMGLGQADYVTLESILADPPHILLISAHSAGQTHPLLEKLHGTLVADYPANLLYCAGPTIPKARAHLAQIRAEFERDFHPERQ